MSGRAAEGPVQDEKRRMSDKNRPQHGEAFSAPGAVGLCALAQKDDSGFAEGQDPYKADLRMTGSIGTARRRTAGSATLPWKCPARAAATSGASGSSMKNTPSWRAERAARNARNKKQPPNGWSAYSSGSAAVCGFWGFFANFSALRLSRSRPCWQPFRLWPWS